MPRTAPSSWASRPSTTSSRTSSATAWTTSSTIPATGLTQQSTTNGQLTWRKADNWTGFSDGQRTWINGPEGLQQRLNSEQFPWEAVVTQRLTLDQLRNAEYHLPLLGDEDTAIRLVDGMGALAYGEGATERVHVGLVITTGSPSAISMMMESPMPRSSPTSTRAAAAPSST